MKTWNFIKRDSNTGFLLCIFRNFWCELVDILLLLLLADAKLFSRCRLPFFRMFVYVLLKSTKKVENFQLFFLLSFLARFFKFQDCACLVLKSSGAFRPRGNFNRMENDVLRLSIPKLCIKLSYLLSNIYENFTKNDTPNIIYVFYKCLCQ